MDERATPRPSKLESRRFERGSLALEHVLFIAAVVALGTAVFGFYNRMSNYYTNLSIEALPTDIGSPSGATGGSGTSGGTGASGS